MQGSKLRLTPFIISYRHIDISSSDWQSMPKMLKAMNINLFVVLCYIIKK